MSIEFVKVYGSTDAGGITTITLAQLVITESGNRFCNAAQGQGRMNRPGIPTDGACGHTGEAPLMWYADPAQALNITIEVGSFRLKDGSQ